MNIATASAILAGHLAKEGVLALVRQLDLYADSLDRENNKESKQLLDQLNALNDIFRFSPAYAAHYVQPDVQITNPDHGPPLYGRRLIGEALDTFIQHEPPTAERDGENALMILGGPGSGKTSLLGLVRK